MRRFNSNYPISNLLASCLRATCIHSLATTLKYKNEAKMLRRLDEWLLTGKGNPDLLTKLIGADILQEPLTAEALKETSLIHEAEDKALRLKVFRTHIYVQTERLVEGGFFMGLLASKVKYLFDDELTSSSDEGERLKIAATICQNHFSSHGGQCEHFGQIIGYKFCPELDRVWSITPTGEIGG